VSLVVQKYGGSSVADADGIKRVAQRIAAGAGEVRLAFVGPEDQGADLLEAATA